MGNDFEFSVLMPIYNVEKYLADAIDSLINQSIGFEENIELVIVDDGSPDNSKDISLKYQEKYPEETKKEKSAEEYKGAEQDWVLLLQLGTIEDEESNNCLMWGDGGYLYFWIRRDDLAARRFDRTVMVLQCG